jgi:hypothetical protein
MALIRRDMRTMITLTFAIACTALAVLWPEWRQELRAQGYPPSAARNSSRQGRGSPSA